MQLSEVTEILSVTLDENIAQNRRAPSQPGCGMAVWARATCPAPVPSGHPLAPVSACSSALLGCGLWGIWKRVAFPVGWPRASAPAPQPLTLREPGTVNVEGRFRLPCFWCWDWNPGLPVARVLCQVWTSFLSSEAWPSSCRPAPFHLWGAAARPVTCVSYPRYVRGSCLRRTQYKCPSPGPLYRDGLERLSARSHRQAAGRHPGHG